MFFKNLFMSIRHMKKEHRNTRFLLLLFLCTEQLTDTNLFTFSQDRAGTGFAALCHILYFDAAKFSIKLFSLVYFFLFLLSDNRMNMK